MKEHASEFHEAGTERCVYVMRQDAQGNPINLDKADGIKLQPSEKLVIIVMNTDDLLIMYTQNAKAHVDSNPRSIPFSRQHHDSPRNSTSACTSLATAPRASFPSASMPAVTSTTTSQISVFLATR